MKPAKAIPYALFALFVCLCLVSLPGCSRRSPEVTGSMGSPIVVGQLTYIAYETEWRDSLLTTKGSRDPKNKFYFVRITVTNKASEEKAAPLLQVEASDGKVYPELTEGEGVPQWMGYLRLLQPGETRLGVLLFDVPQAAYKLRISSGGDPEGEQTATIDLPLQVNPPPQSVSPLDPAASGGTLPAPGKKK